MLLWLLTACLPAYPDDWDHDGFSAADGDCDDTNSAISPGAAELCDSTDNDCDGAVDEDTGSVWYPDSDEDGYGDEGKATAACTAPDGHTSQGGDCDDNDANASPEAPETCDEVDNNCDGAIDEGAGEPWYADSDGDGYGDPDKETVACTRPEGHAANPDDCDDRSADTRPTAAEICSDGIDNDCDGLVGDACRWSGTIAPEDAMDAIEGTGSIMLGAYLDFAPKLGPGGADMMVLGAPGLSAVRANQGGALLIEAPPPSGNTTVEEISWLLIGGPQEQSATGPIGALGDQDGDGHPELLLGTPLYRDSLSERGAVFLLHGPISASRDLASEAPLRGEEAGERLGHQIVVPGDLDGDGREDIVLPSPFRGGGIAWVITQGFSTGTVSTAQALLLSGAHNTSGTTDRVSAAGDVNADGRADLLITERDYGSGGVLWIAEGPLPASGSASVADMPSLTGESSYRLGNPGRAGDVNGDGYDDYLVGEIGLEASTRDGRAYLISGATTINSGDVRHAALAQLSGAAEGTETSQHLSGGDTDGDGFDDIVVATPGAVSLLYGPISGSIHLDDAPFRIEDPNAEDTAFGLELHIADVTGEGLRDVIVGAPGTNNSRGAVLFLPGQGL